MTEVFETLPGAEESFSSFDDEDAQEECASVTYNQRTHRRNHLEQAKAHIAAAKAVLGIVRLEHLYAASLHQEIANGPLTFTLYGRARFPEIEV